MCESKATSILYRQLSIINDNRSRHLHPSIATWFRDQVGRPTDVQNQAWPRIADGEHVLITAGKLGDIRHVAHDHYYNRTSTKSWRREESRLEISIFSIHILDRIRSLAGSRSRMVSATTRAWDPNMKGESFTILRIDFENDAIESGNEPPHSGCENLGTMEIVDAAYLSAERGEPVEVEELRIGAGVDGV